MRGRGSSSSRDGAGNTKIITVNSDGSVNFDRERFGQRMVDCLSRATLDNHGGFYISDDPRIGVFFSHAPIAEATDKFIDDAGKQLGSLFKVITELQEGVEKQTEFTKSLEEKLRQTKQEAAELRTDLASRKREHDDSKKVLDKVIKDLRTENKQHLKQIADLTRRLDNAKREDEKIDPEKNQLQQKIKELEQEIDKTRGLLEHEREQREKLGTTLAKVRQMHEDELQKQADVYQAQTAALKQTVQSLTASLQDLKQSAEEQGASSTAASSKETSAREGSKAERRTEEKTFIRDLKRRISELEEQKKDLERNIRGENTAREEGISEGNRTQFRDRETMLEQKSVLKS